MRDYIASNCEAAFVLDAIDSKIRLDGRAFDEHRKIELNFGSDLGCAYVTLGETKVVAQASCELTEPRAYRPNEGNIYINLEISDLVCGVFETGYQNHLSVETNHLLERCLKESRCVDLESLCVISAEQVWEIRVDISVLNFDGNLYTCCSLAALAALAHFRTPQVTLENSEIVIHSIRERDPQPVSLHHYPVLVAFAVFSNGSVTVLDPTELEEKVRESELVIGMNNFREICGMHFSGKDTAHRSLILSAASHATRVAAELVKLVKAELAKDTELRKETRNKIPGLVTAIKVDRILSACQDRTSLRPSSHTGEPYKILKDRKLSSTDDVEMNHSESHDSVEENIQRHFVTVDNQNGASISSVETTTLGKSWEPSGSANAWQVPNTAPSSSSDDDDEHDDDVDYVKTITAEDRIIDRIDLGGDSEEEEIVVLQSEDLQ